MQLTQFSDYSLRTLIYLSARRERATIREIAEWYGISKPHLVKVVHHLAKRGYIETVQGRGGGIRLKGDPESITLGRLLRDTEPHFHMVECFDAARNTCRITDTCGLKHILHDATHAFLNVLDQHTLADIAQPIPQKGEEHVDFV